MGFFDSQLISKIVILLPFVASLSLLICVTTIPALQDFLLALLN
jgi:hypothetical protein